MDTGAERMIDIRELLGIREHTLGFADSQNGKTTTSLYICQLQNLAGYTSIFFNLKDDDKLYNIKKTKQGAAKYINVSLEQFKYLLEQKVTDGIIEVRPEPSDVPIIEQIEPYLKFLLAWKKINREHKVYCVIDEIHLLQSKQSLMTSIKNLWVMGKGLNLFMGGLSQRYTMVHNDLFTQTEYFFMQGCNPRDLKAIYDGRYLAIPDGWIVPLNQPESTYPWKQNKYRLFVQLTKFDGLFEIAPLNKPPF